MKLTSILVSLLMIACEGSQFQASNLDIGPDAATSDSNPPLPDGAESSPDSDRADGRGGFESDADADSTDGSDDATNDAWPADVILEPYCPTSEVYPNFSNTCYTWGNKQGWTLTGCCLPDHSCGTVIQGMCRK